MTESRRRRADTPIAAGPVYIPDGLGLPAGYYTPSAAPLDLPRIATTTRRTYSRLVVGAALLLGLVVGAAIGAAVVAAVGGR